MSRRPAHLTGGIAPRDAVWEALRALGETDLGELSRRSGQPLSLVEDYMRALRKAEIVEAVYQTAGPLGRFRTVYKLIRDLGLDAPRLRKDGSSIPTSGRQRMWRAMAILKEFSLRDLMATASLPEAPIAQAEAHYYCEWLAKGGYLRPSGPGRYITVAAMRHGPRSPMIQRVRRLLDPNTGEIVCESHPVEEKAR